MQWFWFKGQKERMHGLREGFQVGTRPRQGRVVGHPDHLRSLSVPAAVVAAHGGFGRFHVCRLRMVHNGLTFAGRQQSLDVEHGRSLGQFGNFNGSCGGIVVAAVIGNVLVQAVSLD